MYLFYNLSYELIYISHAFLSVDPWTERLYVIMPILSTEHIGGSGIMGQLMKSVSFMYWNLFGYSGLEVNRRIVCGYVLLSGSRAKRS